MIARYTDYASFSTAVEMAGHNTHVLYVQAREGIQTFSAIAPVMGTAVVLRFDAESEPETFAANFPKAILASGLDS